MARRIIISTIGASPPMAATPDDSPALISDMLAFWQKQLNKVLPDRPDLIVLPEMCDRYDGLNKQQALAYRVARGDSFLQFFQEAARRNCCHILYASERQAPDGFWRNSAMMIGRDGEIVGAYEKNYVVISETTDWDMQCGNEANVIECDFGRVACAICFDLNFDELRVKYKAAQPDIILYPSMDYSSLVQAYWAYSCQAYFVGCVGVSELPSEIISPVGHTIAASDIYFNHATAVINLDYRVVHLDGNWGKLTRLKEKYGSQVTLISSGHLGSVLLSCEADDKTIDELVQEFEIELLDDFLNRSRAHNRKP